MVLWGFLGIRRHEAASSELGSARPLVLLATGIALAAMFVAGLVGAATLAVRALGG
jgi:hypothetical protein